MTGGPRRRAPLSLRRWRSAMRPVMRSSAMVRLSTRTLGSLQPARAAVSSSMRRLRDGRIGALVVVDCPLSAVRVFFCQRALPMNLNS